MDLQSALTFLGGIGLFLLGMKLMTDGLTSAAGNTLRAILSIATHSRARAILSGIAITALVQSSSAVIFTTVGFVNASLLSLGQAVGVIYGSNLGTTFTSWIVALLGFNLDLQAFALPAIGIGMAISVISGSRRYGAVGRALAGFGLFFLGIDVLRDAFDGLGDTIALEAWAGQGILSLLLFLGIGIVLTVLMQSSSAALAVTLTATAGGLIPLAAAAAMVIGANVGTTTTGLFAVIGATAPAKRAASAHVIFNLVTGLVAFFLLPVLLDLVQRIAHYLGSEDNLATSLALFHTLVNFLGLIIMLPFTNWMVALLERRFRSLEEDSSRPQFLDRNVQATPSLAVDALAQELHRMNAFAGQLAKQAISEEVRHDDHLEQGHRALETLSYAISEFASGIPRSQLGSELLNALPDAQRVAQYLVNVAEHVREIVPDAPVIELRDEHIRQARHSLRARAVALIDQAKVDRVDWDVQTLNEMRANFEAEYQGLKASYLRAGTTGSLDPRTMAAALERLSALHRVIDQQVKAAVYIDRYIVQTRVNLSMPAEALTAPSEALPAEVEASPITTGDSNEP
jgi:phosphate:Na+ symporter